MSREDHDDVTDALDDWLTGDDHDDCDTVDDVIDKVTEDEDE